MAVDTLPRGARRTDRGRRPPWASLLAVPVVVVLWSIVSAAGLVSGSVLPTPWDVCAALVRTASPADHFQLELDALETLRRLVEGTVIATVVGVPLGVLLGARPRARAVAQPVVLSGLTLPALAMAPLYMVFFGIGEGVSLAVVAVEAVIPIVVTVATGYRGIPVHLIWAAKALGARRGFYWRSVALPALTVPIVSGLRIGMGYAWRALLAVEGITALKHGLGYRTFQAAQYFDSRTVFVQVVVVALIGILLETVVLNRIERRTVVRWGVAER